MHICGTTSSISVHQGFTTLISGTNSRLVCIKSPLPIWWFMVLFRWDPNWGVNCSCSKSQVCRSLLIAIEGEEVPDETSKFLMPWFPVFPFISFIHSSCLMCLHLCFPFNYQDSSCLMCLHLCFPFNYQDGTELVESCFTGDHCWRALHKKPGDLCSYFQRTLNASRQPLDLHHHHGNVDKQQRDEKKNSLNCNTDCPANSPPSQKPMTRAQISTNRNLNHSVAPLNARCEYQRFLQICIGPARLYYNEFSSIAEPKCPKKSLIQHHQGWWSKNHLSYTYHLQQYSFSTECKKN